MAVRRPGDLDSVYVSYWSLKDPLCLSQSIPVLRELARHGFRIGLFTYEQPPWRLEGAARAEARRELAALGVEWWPLRYHKVPAVLSTVFDILVGAIHCVRVARRRRVRLFHGRGTVPAAVTWLASRLTGTLFFDDADGPLAEEYADAGVWKRGSLAHRMTRAAERRFLAAADVVAVLTERRREEVRRDIGREVMVLPCGVDLEHFHRRAGAEAGVRRQLGLEGTVFVYAGKSGGWYMTGGMLEFVAAARESFPDASLLVLTPDAAERFEKPAAALGLRCRVLRVTREQMPAYLSAADAALSFVLPVPSKAACSPIKNGEYLACGLPVVTTPRIGDYSDLIARRDVGVVLEELDGPGYRRAAGALKRLLQDPSLRSRCRDVARAEVGLHEVVIPRYLRIYQGVLGSSEGS